MRTISVGLCVTLAVMIAVRAQEAPVPIFEVATIKANTSGAIEMSARATPGRFIATNMPLRQLIRYAYQLQESELVGGVPSELRQRFDVTATAKDAASLPEIRIMLRGLLAARFKLAVHTETRDLPVFYLEVARADGRLGPQLRASTAICDGCSSGDVGPTNADSSRQCGYLGPDNSAVLPTARSRMALRGLTMEQFSRLLEGSVRRRVIDRTSVKGVFDGEFDLAAELGPPPPPPGAADPVDRPSLPSLFTILPEQLGLRLRASTGPLPVTVIDHTEPPSPD